MQILGRFPGTGPVPGTGPLPGKRLSICIPAVMSTAPGSPRRSAYGFSLYPLANIQWHSAHRPPLTPAITTSPAASEPSATPVKP